MLIPDQKYLLHESVDFLELQGQQTHETMLNIIHHQETANQNHGDTPLYLSERLVSERQEGSVGKDAVKREASRILGGNVN